MNQATRGKEEMSRKSLLKSESAAAIAIAAVLLLGLAFTIISVVKLNYAPEWKIDAERDYSYDAWSNMEDVKTRADIFTKFMGSDVNYPYGLSANVPFSMGGGDVPVFEPSKSNSKLAVNTEKCMMSITLAKYPLNTKTVDCGGVTYYSENRQYPDQVFRYENGALIISQGSNSQMKRNPSFNIQKNSTSGNYTVIINAINLIGEPSFVSSSTSTALRLTGDSIEPLFNSSKDYLGESIDSFNLNISTHYTDAWVTYLNNTAKEKELVYNTDYTIESVPHDHVCISFNLSGKLDGIYVNKTKLYAELGRKVGGGVLPNENVMQLNRWYCFNTVSVTGMNLSYLSDYGTGANLSTQSTGQVLSEYSSISNIFTFNLNKKTFEPTFGFSNFTEFEYQPSSATILMIYRPKFNNPKYQEMNVSGKPLPNLTGNTKDIWYLYQQTATNLSISNPSNLTYYIKIGEENGKNEIEIDYLAVYLS